LSYASGDVTFPHYTALRAREKAKGKP